MGLAEVREREGCPSLRACCGAGSVLLIYLFICRWGKEDPGKAVKETDTRGKPSLLASSPSSLHTEVVGGGGPWWQLTPYPLAVTPPFVLPLFLHPHSSLPGRGPEPHFTDW